MAVTILLNGQTRELPDLNPGCSLAELLAQLGFQSDRVAVERNGEIVPRRTWSHAQVADQDKLEVVHFVGGGSAQLSPMATLLMP